MTRNQMFWTTFLALAGSAALGALLSTLVGCAQPSVQPTKDAGAIPHCGAQPSKVYYGSCGDKLAQNAPFTESPLCALCEDQRGCSPSVGVYCVGELACDDPRCRER